MRRISACLAFLTFLAVPGANAVEPLGEYQIKAGFLYKFLLFAEWPETEDLDVTIGIVGDDPFGEAFAPIVGTDIDGRKLSIARFQDAASKEPHSACQILFLSGSLDEEEIGRILTSVGESPVLTVSEVEGFLEQGGMVNLLLMGEKVRFEVNRAVADRAGIDFRSQLLRLATRVVEIEEE